MCSGVGKRRHCWRRPYPADQPRAQLAEELEVKVANAWVQFVANEEIVNGIA
jgi:hypothetical protein